MIKNDKKIKDKKIQFYLPQIDNDILYKRYPYTEQTFEDGGLWAYVRDKTQIEKIQSGMAVEKVILECRINYNPIIGNEYKAIYRNNMYDVSLPDNYEGYMEETKFTLTLSVDNNNYTGEAVYEQT